MKKLILIALITISFQAYADYSYDYRNGNSYNTEQESDGSTEVDGYNDNTGSQWQTNIQQNGDMNGTDSNDNSWTYNSDTKTYQNSDGTTCTGEGEFRQCY